MPAVVFTAPYVDRSAWVVCPEHELDERFERTAEAQEAAATHNRERHLP